MCDTCTYQKPKDENLQQLLREFLFWVCRFNFFPIMQKIASKENNVADYISRVYAKDSIDNYFESCGYVNQTSVNIPLEWFSFQAEW